MEKHKKAAPWSGFLPLTPLRREGRGCVVTLRRTALLWLPDGICAAMVRCNHLAVHGL